MYIRLGSKTLFQSMGVGYLFSYIICDGHLGLFPVMFLTLRISGINIYFRAAGTMYVFVTCHLADKIVSSKVNIVSQIIDVKKKIFFDIVDK